MTDKPVHLGREYAAQFELSDVAQAYYARPAYPAAVFDVLAELLPSGARALELGAGTGDLTVGLAERCRALDAVEPSAAMLAIARGRCRATHVTWHACSAEAFAYEGPYGLAVAAESLHWMDWAMVLPQLAAALTPEGVLAVITERRLTVPWSPELSALIARHSTNREYQAYDLIALLEERGLFRTAERRTLQRAFSQPLDDYIESFHSRNGFSRERMGVERAAAFDDSVRELAAQHGASERVQGSLEIQLAWGRPLPL